MNETALLYNFLAVGGVLFALGLVGFLVRRNMIVMFLCAEMMLQGVSVSLVGFGRYHNDWGGQMLVVFIITVAACEAGIALALFLMLYRRKRSLDIGLWQSLREPGMPESKDVEPLPSEPMEEPLPKLPPAGVAPGSSKEHQHV